MSEKIKIEVKNLDLYYGENHALKNVNMDIFEKKITIQGTLPLRG